MLLSLPFLNVTFGFHGLTEMMNPHPVLVHFPAALLSASAVFYFLGTLLGRESLLSAAKWTLWAGTLGAGLAVWSGLYAEATVPHGGGTHDLMEMHEHAGITVLVLSSLLSLWVLIARAALPGRGRPIFLVLLVLMVLALAQGAEWGGRLVYLNGVGIGRKSMMSEAMEGHAHHDHDHDHDAHEDAEPGG